MTRRDNLELKKAKKGFIIVIIAETIIISFAIGCAMAYSMELESLQSRIKKHDKIPSFVKEELVPGYTNDDDGGK